MNKRFSTLVAAALVVGGLSVSAQGAQDGKYFTKPGDLKASEYPFVYLSNEKVAGIDLAVTSEGELKAHSQIDDLSAKDSTIAMIDSMAWKVIEVPGAVTTFKFQNRATGHFLSLKAKEYETTVDISDKAISTWALDDENGLQAQVGDSLYYLGVKNDGTGFCLIRKDGTNSDITHRFFPRAIKNTIFLTADDFNKEIKGFKFAAVTDRDAKSDVDGGATNILTATQWEAKTNTKLKDTQGHQYLLFQKKGSKDETGYLKVDTNYVDGTSSYKFTLDSCKIGLNTEASAIRGYARYDVREEGAEDPSYIYTIHDSLALFRVTYDYSRDSLNIYPVALPAKKHVNVWEGADASKVDTVSVMFYSEKFGVKEGGDSAMVALRTLDHLTCLVVDSCKTAKLNAKDEGSIGVTVARIISTGRSTALGGDARIATNKVYFMKSMNKAAKGGVGGNADYDKYKVVSLNATETFQTTKGSAFMPSTQWIVKEGNADGLYTVMNREFADKKISGSFNVVKDADGKAIANTYVCNNDTILLEDAECASVEGLITVKGHKRATTGYGYFEPTTLVNKKFKIASASPYLEDLFMQSQKGSLALSKDEFGFKLEVADNKEFGAEVAGVDTLYRQSYRLVTDKGECVTLMNNKMSYGLSSEKKDASVFFLKSINAGTYALIDTTGLGSGKDEDWTKAHQVAVNVQSETPAIMAVAVGSKLDLFTVTELDAPSMLFSAPDHFNVYNNNDRLAMGKDNMAVMAQPGNELKADADKFVNNDFTLWFDTVNYKADIEASYFISKGVEKATEEKAAAERLYLTLACEDSTNIHPLGAKYQIDGMKRLYFRTAARYGVDSLIVNNFDEEAGVIAPDTVCAGVTETTFNEATKTNQLKGIENFKFRFEVIPGTTDNYYMKVLNNTYVASMNGLLVAVSSSPDSKMVVTLKAPDYETANEATPAVSEVKVIATDGGVQIVGAEGKKVVITNILGQTVANAVLTSSDVTIAAPAGVVVVAVEGEEAVKAIVK